VRNRENFGASPLLEFVERFPEIFGILAVELGKRDRLVRFAGVATENDVPVQIVSAHSGEFVADQGCEATGLVVLVSEGGVFVPGFLYDRLSLARRLWVVVISSPRANRKASSRSTVHMVPASTETAVWRWVIAKEDPGWENFIQHKGRTREGNCRQHRFWWGVGLPEAGHWSENRPLLA